jgi:hypothetical protein
MSLSLDQIVSDSSAAMFNIGRKGPVFVTRTGRAGGANTDSCCLQEPVKAYPI